MKNNVYNFIYNLFVDDENEDNGKISLSKKELIRFLETYGNAPSNKSIMALKSTYADLFGFDNSYKIVGENIRKDLKNGENFIILREPKIIFTDLNYFGDLSINRKAHRNLKLVKVNLKGSDNKKAYISFIEGTDLKDKEILGDLGKYLVGKVMFYNIYGQKDIENGKFDATDEIIKEIYGAIGEYYIIRKFHGEEVANKNLIRRKNMLKFNLERGYGKKLEEKYEELLEYIAYTIAGRVKRYAKELLTGKRIIKKKTVKEKLSDYGLKAIFDVADDIYVNNENHSFPENFICNSITIPEDKGYLVNQAIKDTLRIVDRYGLV